MAYSEIQKLAIKQKIAETTTQLLIKKDFHDINMEAIAHKNKMAKGSLYNYFSSKESLFLNIYVKEATLWIEEVTKVLNENKQLKKALSSIVKKHCQRTLFLKLMGLINSVLEQKLSYSEALNFKQELFVLVQDLDAVASNNFPQLPKQFFGKFIIHYNAHLVGLLQMSTKSKALEKVFRENPELGVFNPDVEKMLKQFVHMYFHQYL